MEQRNQLETIVDKFNTELECWEQDYNYGANFEWFYNHEGKKRVRIKDLAPIEKLPQDEAATKIQEVHKVMEVLDGQIRI